MRPALLVLSLALVPSCEFFDGTLDDLAALTHPVILEALVLGIDASAIGDDLDLAELGYGDGVALTVFLADAADLQSMDDLPVSGAVVTIDGTVVPQVEPGFYLREPDGKPYTPGATWTVSTAVGAEVGTAAIALPPEMVVEVPEAHEPVQALTLTPDNGEAFDQVLVVVLSATGGVTYDNTPQDILSLYEFTRQTTGVGEVVVPAEAFPSSGLYAVGVAGLVITPGDDFDNMNTLLSNGLAGELVFYDVAVGPADS